MLSGRATVSVLAVPGLLVSASCVPEGPATGDASSRPAGTSASPAGASRGTPLGGVFEDNFDRPALGPDWNALSAKGRVAAEDTYALERNIDRLVDVIEGRAGVGSS